MSSFSVSLTSIDSSSSSASSHPGNEKSKPSSSVGSHIDRPAPLEIKTSFALSSDSSSTSLEQDFRLGLGIRPGASTSPLLSPRYTSALDPLHSSITAEWLDSTLDLNQPDHPTYRNVNADGSLANDEDRNSDLSDSEVAAVMHAFDVSYERGFLPPSDPLPRLTSPKYAVWEELMDDLTRRLHCHNIRTAVDQLPHLTVTSEDLSTPAELRRAMLLLSILAHAYVWGESPVVDFIPSSIARPWVTVAHKCGRVAVLTHSSIVLSNWKRLDVNKPIEIGNIAMLNGFYNGIDEAHFYLVTVEVESRGAPSLAWMLRAQHYARTEQVEKLTNALHHIAECQKAVLESLCKMSQSCDPYIFYTRVRPFLAGWKGNPVLPHGLLYRGVSSEPQHLHGGSAAQSSLIASFDVFLGVEHSSDHTREYMKDMRYYMPGSHREFLNFLSKGPNVRKVVEKFAEQVGHSVKQTAGYKTTSGKSNTNSPSGKNSVSGSGAGSGSVEAKHACVSAFNACLDQLTAFRNKHIQIVALYILAQAHNKGNRVAEQINFMRDHEDGYSRGSVLQHSPTPPHMHPGFNLSSQGEMPTVGPSKKTSMMHKGVATAAGGGGCGYHMAATSQSNSPSSSSLVQGKTEDKAKEAAEEEEAGAPPESVPTPAIPPVSFTEERGTGGTSIMPFLKTARDETKQTKLTIQ